MMRLVPMLMLAGTSATVFAGPNDWPHWRGPAANGTAPNADPPLTWDAKTNIKWKAELPGRGSATPIVWGDQVFVVTAVKTDRAGDGGRAARRSTRSSTGRPSRRRTSTSSSSSASTGTPGKLNWKQKAAEKVPHEGHHETHSYAAGSPTTDGERLYVSFGSFGIYCYDLDGKPLWERDLGRLNTRLGWGEAVTPVVHGDSLLLNWDQEANSKLVCLDAADRQDEMGGPARREDVLEHAARRRAQGGDAGHRQRHRRTSAAYDLATGKAIWTGPPA